MKTLKISIITGCMAIAALTSMALINKVHAVKPVATGGGFAVIELFTSEGCSSCPPADELVAKVQKESDGKPVYILAYHVDYWNRLGWKDVFSSAEYSQRQGKYAQWLHLESVYTPQIVVNGRTEFVGSEEGNLRNAIKNNLQKTTSTELTINNVKVNQDKAIVQYHVEGAGKNAALVIALVEKAAQTKVKNGENGGRTLSHVQIVRKLQSISVNDQANGSEGIDLPATFEADGWELIAFIQNTGNGQIIAATRTALPLAASATSASLKNSK